MHFTTPPFIHCCLVHVKCITVKWELLRKLVFTSSSSRRSGVCRFYYSKLAPFVHTALQWKTTCRFLLGESYTLNSCIYCAWDVGGTPASQWHACLTNTKFNVFSLPVKRFFSTQCFFCWAYLARVKGLSAPCDDIWSQCSLHGDWGCLDWLKTRSNKNRQQTKNNRRQLHL